MSDPLAIVAHYQDRAYPCYIFQNALLTDGRDLLPIDPGSLIISDATTSDAETEAFATTNSHPVRLTFPNHLRPYIEELQATTRLRPPALAEPPDEPTVLRIPRQAHLAPTHASISTPRPRVVLLREFHPRTISHPPMIRPPKSLRRVGHGLTFLGAGVLSLLVGCVLINQGRHSALD